MPIRPIEHQANQRKTTVGRSVDAVVNIGGIVAAARGNAAIGATGESGIVTNPAWPEIDPDTGEAVVEPVAPPDFFRAGDKVGVKAVKP